MKKALITGISGQDGYFLLKLLLEKGYEVHGFIRRNSQTSLGSLEYLPREVREKIAIHWGDIIDHTIVESVIREGQFDEIYHLAAQSFVGISFTNPKATYDINIGGTLNVVNAIKEFSAQSKLYFAATSELYGKTQCSPQDENTSFYPRSPYGVSKLAGFWTVKNYREAYGLFMSNGILFNHESEFRGEEFVTRKITKTVAAIAGGVLVPLRIGNLYARRDWGYASDYVAGMWAILQHGKPDEFVLATGENHSVKEFIEEAFRVVKIDLEWRGEGIDEHGINKHSDKTVVVIDPQHFRPTEVENILGNSTKAREKLGWRPTITFSELVERMVKADIERMI